MPTESAPEVGYRWLGAFTDGVGRRKALLVSWAVAAVLALAFCALIAVPLSAEVRGRASSLLLLIPIAVALAAAIVTCVQTRARERVFWASLVSSLAVFFVGFALRAYSVWVDGAFPSYDSPAHFVLLFGLVVLLPMALLLPDSSRFGRLRRMRDDLDFAAVMTGLAGFAVIAIHAWLHVLFQDSGEWERLALVTLPVVGAAPTVRALIVKRGSWSVWYGSLAAGIAVGAFGAQVIVYGMLLGTYAPGRPFAIVAEGAIFTSFALFGLAGLHRIGAPNGSVGETLRAARSRWPAAAMMVARLVTVPALLLLSFGSADRLEAGLVVGLAALLATLLAARGGVIASENRELAMVAMNDQLTGLASHVAFREVLDREAVRATRDGRSLSLCVFDVNGLDSLNRAQGYVAGDTALREIASVLSAGAGHSGEAARTGGGEFALMLPSADGEAARAACGSIAGDLAAALSEKAGDLRVAVGVAELPRHASDATELLRLARGAAYWSGEIGGYEIAVYDPLLVDVLDSRQHMARLERDTHSKTIESLAAAVEARDHYTRGHSQNVAEICAALAAQAGLSEERCEAIHAAAILHDVGKIGIPDSVLLKTTALSRQELDQIQRHPELGERILQSVVRPDMLKWIRAHHERWDGTGYPDGLRAEDIPLEARILSIGDSFDAMRSDRPYRSGMTLDAALAEVRGCAGSQFDPALVEHFVKIALNGAVDRLGSTPLQDECKRFLHPTLPSFVSEILDDQAYGPLLAVNSAFTEMYGYSREGALSMTPEALAAGYTGVSDPDRGPARIIIETLLAGEAVATERAMRRSDGSVLWVELIASLVEQESRRLVVMTTRPLYADSATRRAMQRRAHKLEALSATTIRLNENLPLHDILSEGLRCASEVIEARQGGIGILRPDRRLDFDFMLPGGEIMRAVTVEATDRVCEGVLTFLTRYVNNGIEGEFDGNATRAVLGIRSLLAVPMVSRDGRPIGILEVHNSLHAFNADDAAILDALAAALATAIENAWNRQHMENQRGYLLEQRSRLLSLTSELAMTEERERRAIAADLHDGIGQTLQICKMMISRAAAGDPAAAKDALDSAESLLAQAIGATRTLISEISPPMLYDIGLEAALEWLVDSTGQNIKTACTYTDDLSMKPMSETLRAVVYRMARELFLNAVKHSGGAAVDVRTRLEQDLICVEVRDDGGGMHGDLRQDTFGLRHVREQIGSLGGRLEVESRAGRGTTIRMWVPLWAGQSESEG